jgi:hypothetical protein
MHVYSLGTGESTILIFPVRPAEDVTGSSFGEPSISSNAGSNIGVISNSSASMSLSGVLRTRLDRRGEGCWSPEIYK